MRCCNQSGNMIHYLVCVQADSGEDHVPAKNTHLYYMGKEEGYL